MKYRGVLAWLVCFTFLSGWCVLSTVQAQRPMLVPPPAPPPPVAPAEVPAETVALQSGSETLAACLMRVIPNVSAVEAVKVTRAICDALRARGVSVDAPGLSAHRAATVAYHVSLSSRGAGWNVTLRKEAAAGGVTSQVTVNTLAGIDALAPRLADAVEAPPAIRASVPAALGVGTVVTGAVPDAPRKPPEPPRSSGVLPQFSWGPGLAVYGFPGGHQWLSPGLALEVGYEAAHFAIVHGLRVGIGDAGTEQTELSRVTFDFGARWFPVNGPTSFFLGAGIGFLYLNVDDDPAEDFTFNFDSSGSGGDTETFRGDEGGGFGYLELGFELWRTSHTHLLAFGRAEFPTFEVNSFIGSNAREYRYIVPVSIGTTLLF